MRNRLPKLLCPGFSSSAFAFPASNITLYSVLEGFVRLLLLLNELLQPVDSVLHLPVGLDNTVCLRNERGMLQLANVSPNVSAQYLDVFHPYRAPLKSMTSSLPDMTTLYHLLQFCRLAVARRLQHCVPCALGLLIKLRFFHLKPQLLHSAKSLRNILHVQCCFLEICRRRRFLEEAHVRIRTPYCVQG